MADNEPIKIIVNDVELVIPEGDTTPFIENDRTLVPMRAIFEALGAKVNWDGETKTIVSYDPVSDVSITMQIDSANMFVGEESVELDVPAKIVNDRTVVPIRAIAEGMNSEVKWDGETRTVTVTKDITKADEPFANMPNPWTEYATLDELNAAI
ncbi:MAG: copper amine oxidase N-terminal domain-containing protein, partial [Clostridia bacterium]|nr:copper amine oxidase N-terminal domain-containing protein [Clostridia bacterium]